MRMSYGYDLWERGIGMGSDELLRFEEENYEWLVEKLIKREQEAWLALVEDEFNKSQQGREIYYEKK